MLFIHIYMHIGATFDIFTDLTKEQIKDENMKIMKGLHKCIRIHTLI